MPSNAIHRPLIVDLDGTLIKTDLLAETASAFAMGRPLALFQMLLWLLRGRTELKARLAQSGDCDVTMLPYNQQLLDWLRTEKAKGRLIVLATGAHRLLADRVANHLGLFDQVMATEGAVNMKAEVKRDALVKLYGPGGFDYVGNDASDLPVWKSAGLAHVVSRSGQLAARAGAHGNLGLSLGTGTASFGSGLLKAMRPHQWVKNLLVFVPLLAAHLYGSPASLLQAAIAFIAFALAASGVYLFNDLMDVASDRHHASKRHRPFAAGDLSLLHGWLAWPLLLFVAMALSLAALPAPFTGVLILYVALSACYSLRLKQIPVVDVLTLGSLYTLRIVAGAAAIAVPLSFWLLCFSMFLFVSLAFMKRYSELKLARDAGRELALRGRGYTPADLELVATFGASAGHVAVLVLALYIQDSHSGSMYAQPRLLWLACPVLLYWISRAWLLAHRGQMNEDPILFAVKDRASWICAALLGVVFVLARLVP